MKRDSYIKQDNEIYTEYLEGRYEQLQLPLIL